MAPVALPVALPEVQRRVRAAMEAFARDYMDGDDRSELDGLFVQVRRPPP